MLTFVLFVDLYARGGVENTRLEAKAKDSPSEDRPSPSQGQECSRPSTKDTVGKCSPNKKSLKILFLIFQAISKKGLTIFFQVISEKKRFKKKFQAINKILTIQQVVLFSSRVQGNFRGLKALRPRPRT